MTPEAQVLELLRQMAARTPEEALRVGLELSQAAWDAYRRVHGPHPDDANPFGVRIYPPLEGETEDQYLKRVSDLKFRHLYGIVD